MSNYWEDNNIKKPQQVIVRAACRSGDIIFAGARHWDSVMISQLKALKFFTNVDMGSIEQGFIDQFGDFITRENALKIVIGNGQKFDINKIRIVYFWQNISISRRIQKRDKSISEFYICRYDFYKRYGI